MVMNLKPDEFYCENYLVTMNKTDCLVCKGRAKCDLKCKTEYTNSKEIDIDEVINIKEKLGNYF